MELSQEVIDRVREAMHDRAYYLALLYRSFCRALPGEEAEKRAREAIFEHGRLKGKRDRLSFGPEDWVDNHVAKGSATIFESRIEKGPDACKQMMTHCPLLDAWKAMGCSPEEQDLLCDIAMEVDRGRAAYHGIDIDIPMRLGKGDPHCCLVLKRKA